MSHYTVLVLVEGTQKVTDLESVVGDKLTPFIEQYTTDADEHFEWQDETDEYLEKFQKESSTMCELPDGEIVAAKWSGSGYEPGLGGRLIEVPHNERYATFAEFMDDYCGYGLIPGTSDRYGYRFNPNAKWDWWVIGGRWEGLLKTTAGENVNYCRRKHLFIDEADARDKATLFYQEVTPIIRGDKDPDGEKQTLSFGNSSIAANVGLRDLQAEQAWVAEHGKDNWVYVAAHPYPTLDEFVENCYSRWLNFQTYSVLDLNGEWHSPGEMGWFGMSTDTPEQNQKFRNEFYDRYLLRACPETWLVVVDCHI